MFDLDPVARLRGVLRSSPASTRDVWTLRELALTDEDGRVRAAATARLAEAVHPDVAWWLREALSDELPSVREAAWTALAKHPLPQVLEHAAVALDVEPSWWVRRAVVWTVGGLRDAAPIVAMALDDPQWRVRHAATRALTAHPAFVRELATKTTSEVVREACHFILGDAPGTTRERPLPLDDDPAVAAERLERGVERLTLPQLVALLADPHETLRAAAEARLALFAPEPLARAVLPWLDEPRAEEAFNAADRLLEDLDVLPLAEEIFERATGRGQLGWAAVTLVGNGEHELVRAALQAPLEAKRGAAFLALGDGEEVPALSLTDRHLAGRATLTPDPAERVFDFTLERAVAALEQDEPIERRAAAVFLAKHHAQPGEEVVRELAGDEEPDLRAVAVSLARSGEHLEVLLRLNLDVDPGVRSLAAEGLEAWPRLRERLTALVTGAPSPCESGERVGVRGDTDTLRAAWQWIARLSDTPLETLASASSTDERLTTHLAALTLAHGGEASVPATNSRAESSPRIAPGPGPRRELGTTGVQVSPLVLSGANKLNVAGFAEAAERGLNTFFWEPEATSTTRFLRTATPECQVVTGSYHSGAAPIRRDVETALRRLGRDRLDVFLLFWVRSAGRLSAENLETLERLRDEGKLATFGFSTHLKDVAIDAMTSSRWPVVMTRLSLAHPSAETTLLPRALDSRTGIFTFTSTCYGRLLTRASAQECYQFALERPGVSAAVIAPRTIVELDQALRALDASPLSDARESELRAHGRAVRESSSAINHFIRHVPSTGRAAF